MKIILEPNYILNVKSVNVHKLRANNTDLVKMSIIVTLMTADLQQVEIISYQTPSSVQENMNDGKFGDGSPIGRIIKGKSCMYDVFEDASTLLTLQGKWMTCGAGMPWIALLHWQMDSLYN